MAKGNGFQSRTCVHFSTTQRLLAIYRKYNHICRNELEAVHHAAGRSERGSVDSVTRTSLKRLFISTGCKRSRTSTIGKVHTIFIKKSSTSSCISRTPSSSFVLSRVQTAEVFL
uniref:Uncharacterized protein n=1 Tax=Rhipicephalus microplus TaxID=6941 RepID=A0A6G5AH36_RHIMP